MILGALGTVTGLGRLVSSSIITTWATKPTVTMVELGQRIYVSDVGVNGSEWFSNGARWCAVGGQVTLAVANFLPAVTGTALEVIAHQYTLPAGLIQNKDILVIERRDKKNAAVESLSARARLGTAGSTADLAIAVRTATTTDHSYLAKLMRTSATNLQALTIGNTLWSTPYATATGTDSFTVPDMDSNALILSNSSQLTAGVESDVTTVLRVLLETN